MHPILTLPTEKQSDRFDAKLAHRIAQFDEGGVFDMLAVFVKNPTRAQWAEACRSFVVFNFLLALHFEFPNGLSGQQRRAIEEEYHWFSTQEYLDKRIDFPFLLNYFSWWEISNGLKAIHYRFFDK